MPAMHSGTDARSPARVLPWLLGLCASAAVVFLLISAVQGPGKWRPTQAWKNLRQIRLALENYSYTHGSLPYDPKGPEYALYVLADDLPASCFDSYPHNKPESEAKWDHDQKRLIDSDFEYLNLPDIDRRSGQKIILAEKPNKSSQSISLLRCDGLTTQCKVPSDSSRDLLGNWDSRDDFLVKGDDLFLEWESVPLPQSEGGYSTATSQAAQGSIWNTRTVHRAFGRVNVYYEYRRGELVRRTFDSPEGKITDTVTTDELGRIVAFTREPKDWQAFWPVKPGRE